MINISVSSNIAETIKQLQAQQKSIEFAKVRALTLTAREAAVDVKAAMPQQIDRPTPFTLGSIGWKGATRADPRSVVFIKPGAAPYLRPLITGEAARPLKGRVLVLAGADTLNSYGNIARRRVKQLLKQRDTFAATLKGIEGIWRREPRGRVKLLIRFEGSQEKRRQFDFAALVAASVQRNFPRFFRQSLEDAMRTAR